MTVYTIRSYAQTNLFTEDELQLDKASYSNKSRMVSEDKDKNYETMSEGVEGENEGVWMDGEDKPPDDLRYNGEGKKNVV